jgi:hypothetical protein
LYAFFGCSPAQTCCKEQEKLSESNYITHNAKNHVKGGHYLPETPQRTRGGEVRWIGAVGQRLVLREVGPGPTDVEPLVGRRRGHPRRIASLLTDLVNAEHNPL